MIVIRRGLLVAHLLLQNRRRRTNQIQGFGLRERERVDALHRPVDRQS